MTLILWNIELNPLLPMINFPAATESHLGFTSTSSASSSCKNGCSRGSGNIWCTPLTIAVSISNSFRSRQGDEPETLDSGYIEEGPCYYPDILSDSARINSSLAPHGLESRMGCVTHHLIA